MTTSQPRSLSLSFRTLAKGAAAMASVAVLGVSAMPAADAAAAGVANDGIRYAATASPVAVVSPSALPTAPKYLAAYKVSSTGSITSI